MNEDGRQTITANDRCFNGLVLMYKIVRLLQRRGKVSK